MLFCGAAVGGRRLLSHSAADSRLLKKATRFGIGLLPAVALGLAALSGLPLYFAGRTESMVWALAAALLAILMCGLPSMARRIVAGSYLFAGLVTVSMWLVDLPSRPPAPGIEVGRVLTSMMEEGDRVVVAGLWQLEVRHGLAQGRLDGSAATPVIVEVETVPRSQADHPGWLDREAAFSSEVFDEAAALSGSAAAKGSRIWLVWSPALPLESTFFPAFAGWHREKVAGSPIITVDLLTPPATEGGTS